MDDKNSELSYLLRLNKFTKFGPRSLVGIKRFFGSWEKAFKADIRQLEMAGIKSSLAEEFDLFRKKSNPQDLMNELSKRGIKVAELGKPGYPKLLEKISDPPVLIYYLGDINCANQASLAVVGARKNTGYGKEIVDTLVSGLAKNGLTIISGLAIGIDSLAHRKALEEKGKTIAVLGSGLDNIYPAANARLAREIISAGGGIISEFPLGTKIFRSNFPRRNRIISGMSLGTLVIEAQRRSGSLITAYQALEQGREVFAVPGDINRLNCQGTNDLIKKGAAAATSPEDIMQCLGLEKESPSPKQTPDLNENEKIIMDILSKNPAYIEEIFKKSELDTKTINSTLSILEIKKLVKNTGNKRYTAI